MGRFYNFPDKIRVFCYIMTGVLSIIITCLIGLLDRNLLIVIIQTGGIVFLPAILYIIILAVAKRKHTIGVKLEATQEGLSVDNKNFFIPSLEIASIDLPILKYREKYTSISLSLIIRLKNGQVFRFEQNDLGENITLLKNMQNFFYPNANAENFNLFLERLILTQEFNNIPSPSPKFILKIIILTLIVIATIIIMSVYIAFKMCGNNSAC